VIAWLLFSSSAQWRSTRQFGYTARSVPEAVHGADRSPEICTGGWATTLDAKIHPAQLAEGYRQGDLLLQDGIMDYRHSQKTAADEQALLDVWHQAQRIAEGSPGGGAKMATSDKTAGAGAQ
jgi:hypothetical protein